MTLTELHEAKKIATRLEEAEQLYEEISKCLDTTVTAITVVCSTEGDAMRITVKLPEVVVNRSRDALVGILALNLKRYMNEFKKEFQQFTGTVDTDQK